jgi:hypothetical protein
VELLIVPIDLADNIQAFIFSFDLMVEFAMIQALTQMARSKQRMYVGNVIICYIATPTKVPKIKPCFYS